MSPALDSRRVAHAYLFDGPPGVGKRSAAIGLALALACPREPGHGCGVCDVCRRVLAGNHPDVISLGPDGTQIIVPLDRLSATDRKFVEERRKQWAEAKMLAKTKQAEEKAKAEAEAKSAAEKAKAEAQMAEAREKAKAEAASSAEKEATSFLLENDDEEKQEVICADAMKIFQIKMHASDCHFFQFLIFISN